MSALSGTSIPATDVVDGVPYFLPTSRIEVSVAGLKGTGGKQEDILVSTKAQLVPDRDFGYLLYAGEGLVLETRAYDPHGELDADLRLDRGRKQGRGGEGDADP